MVKKNRIIVKQPELGQRILELRKAKGLTQEELVDRCNINVRTIQRIEAGEVTPRMFTVKTILEALGYDLSTIQFQESEEEGKADVSIVNPDTSTLKTAFFLGVAYYVLAFVESFLDYLVWGFNPFEYDLSFDPPISFGVYLTIKVTILFTFGSFMFGYYRLATQYPNAIIKTASLILVGLTLVSVVVDSYYPIYFIFR